jgi:small-conductance mechanosensitive channel
MEEFLHYRIVNNENIKISVLNIIWIVIVVAIAILFNWLLRKYLKRTRESDLALPLLARRYFLIINLIIWLIVAALILAILSIPFERIKDYPLINLEKFKIMPIHFFIAAMVIIGTRMLLMGIERLFGFESQIYKGDITRRKNVFKVFSYIIWVIAVLIILNLTGLRLTVFLGAGAALLVGIGFGLQQIFADLISGLFLLFEGNLREDDVVELNDGTIGKVTQIGARTSKVQTRDNVVQIIPNSHFINQEVINWSQIDTRTRFRVDVGVAYGSDVQLVTKVLLECANDHSDISRVPKPFVRFQDFGDSSLDFSLYFWSPKSFEVENIKSDIRFAIEQKFRDNKIQIPFPQRDVHIKSQQ